MKDKGREAWPDMGHAPLIHRWTALSRKYATGFGATAG